MRGFGIALSFFCLFFLAVGTVSIQADAEPNNTVFTAETVELNTTSNGELSTTSPFDFNDYYKFTLTKNGVLQINLAPANPLDLEITLLDEDGETVLSAINSSGEGGAESLTFDHIRPGSYQALVKALRNAGTYRFSLNFTPSPIEDVEPNNVPEQAGVMNPTAQVRGVLGFVGANLTDRYDFFKIELKTPGKLEVFARPVTSLNAYVALLAADGKTVIQEKNERGKGEEEKITVPNLKEGVYYVLITPTEGYGSYSIANVFLATGNNDSEPNDTLLNPLELPFLPDAGNAGLLNGSVKGQLGFFNGLSRDDVDYYLVSLPFHAKLDLKLAPDTTIQPALTVGYELYNQNHLFVSGQPQSNWTTGLLDPGLYTIKMYRGDSYGTYTLSAQLTAQEPPVPPAIPTLSLPTDGASQLVALGELGSISPVRIEIPGDGKLVIQYSNPANMYVEAAVLWPNGQVIQSSYSYYESSTHSFEIPNMRRGSYVIFQSKTTGIATDTAAGVATVSAQLLPATAVDPDDNDDYTQLALSSLDTPINGSIGYGNSTYQDQRDFYMFETREEGDFTFTLKGESTLYSTIILYTYSGSTIQQIASTYQYYSNGEIAVSKDNALAGKYFVFVQLNGGYGSYEAKATLSPNRDNDPEDNDRFWKAKPIELNKGYVGHIGYNNQLFAGDGTDWYSVTLPENGRLRLTTMGDATLYHDIQLFYSNAANRIEQTYAYYTTNQIEIGHNSLRAGKYYILISASGGFGSYRMQTTYVPEPNLDIEPNTTEQIPLEMATGNLVKGSLGYTYNRDLPSNTTDVYDWYRVEVPVDGRYKLTLQTTPGHYLQVRLYEGEGLRSLYDSYQYYSSNLLTAELDLKAGLHFLQLTTNGGYGDYTVGLVPLDMAVTGGIKVVVKDQDGIPVFNVNGTISNLTASTDVEGKFEIGGLAPGTYELILNGGAQYYITRKQVVIEPGKGTEVEGTLLDTFISPPADVERLFGYADDRYATLFWTPSSSPDVADGGGYNLYIDNGPAIDLKNVLSHRLFNLVNGQTYTIRLTAYDKLGLESEGKTLVLTPQGNPNQENPTPTPSPVPSPVPPTATPTQVISLPTATPTQGSQPVPTATLTPLIEPTSTPTPVVVLPSPTQSAPTPTATPINTLFAFEFDRGRLDLNAWAHLPGGFTNAPAGTVTADSRFTTEFSASKDNMGMAVSVDEHEVSFLLAQEGINTQGRPALVRAKIRSSGPGAQVALGALKGTILTGQNLDGTIGMSLFVSTARFVDQDQEILAILKPDEGDTVNPFIQVAGNRPGNVTVWIDRIEVILLDPSTFNR